MERHRPPRRSKRSLSSWGQYTPTPAFDVAYSWGVQELVASMEATAIVGIPSLLTWFAEAHAMLGHHAEGLNCLAEAAQVMAADTWLNMFLCVRAG